jgi:SAM-dependent methyltransferase
MQNIQLKQRIDQLPPSARILDAGGWFKPFLRATHVVDLMPWETRRATLQLTTLADECFTKDTWFQVNFLDPTLRLPFDDKYFDFSICSHTLEDLKQPNFLIQELQRVSREGYIEVPSRLQEQTRGVSDSCCFTLGYFHHHWILDQDGDTLDFYSKSTSLNQPLHQCAIPLIKYQELTAKHPELINLSFFWKRQINLKFYSDEMSQQRARQLKQSLSINIGEELQDYLLILARKARSLAQSKPSSTNWWTEIVSVSTPYSSIPLS